MIRVMSQDKPSAYCDCEPCFLRYVSRYADGKPAGFDTFWDEPYHDWFASHQAYALYVLANSRWRFE